MRYCILASGSKGNSIFVESGHARYLVDVGLSARKIEERLATRNIDPATISGIVLTHAHGDHVKGVGVFAHRHKLPIWGHPDTLDEITPYLKPGPNVKPWTGNFRTEDLSWTPFEVPHDSEPTHGYLISDGRSTLAICTDLGHYTERIREHLLQANAILLESSHDPEMLMSGPYPWHLKDRISGRRGHLSNYDAGELLRSILNTRLRRVTLGHLSDQNNTRDKALNTVLEHVGPRGEAFIGVIEQQTVSEMYVL